MTTMRLAPGRDLRWSLATANERPSEPSTSFSRLEARDHALEPLAVAFQGGDDFGLAAGVDDERCGPGSERLNHRECRALGRLHARLTTFAAGAHRGARIDDQSHVAGLQMPRTAHRLRQRQGQKSDRQRLQHQRHFRPQTAKRVSGQKVTLRCGPEPDGGDTQALPPDAQHVEQEQGPE
jgi:hypothetical protein